MTIEEKISHLKTRLSSINEKIEKQENLREIEEGSNGGRFRTQFADIGKLYEERDKIENKLAVLEAYAII
jgi:hypothetical protein